MGNGVRADDLLIEEMGITDLTAGAIGAIINGISSLFLC